MFTINQRVIEYVNPVSRKSIVYIEIKTVTFCCNCKYNCICSKTTGNVFWRLEKTSKYSRFLRVGWFCVAISVIWLWNCDCKPVERVYLAIKQSMGARVPFKVQWSLGSVKSISDWSVTFSSDTIRPACSSVGSRWEPAQWRNVCRGAVIWLMEQIEKIELAQDKWHVFHLKNVR